MYAMKPRGVYIRSLSLFVVIFLGLNPAAVFCLAYCNYHAQASATAAHCPLKKQSPDCHRSKKSTASKDTTSIVAESAKGCVMPVNVIAAPIQSKFGVAVDAVVTPQIERIEFASVLLVGSRQLPKFYYRPPPNDLRFERVRNQVFRI